MANKQVPVWITIVVALVTLVLGSFIIRVIDGASDVVNVTEMQDYVEKEIDHTEQRWDGGTKTILQFMESQTNLNEKFVGQMQEITVSQAEMRKDIEHMRAE